MPKITIPQGAQTADINYAFNGVPDREDGLTVVMVHGAGGRNEDWPQGWRNINDMNRALGIVPKDHYAGMDDYPIYLLDLPQHGGSTGEASRSVDGYADVIEAFIKAMDMPRVVLVGHSMGAAITLLTAVRQNPRLAGIVMIGSSSKLKVSSAILEGLQTDFEATVDAIVGYSWYSDTGKFFKEKGRERMLETGAEVVCGDYFACADFDLTDQLDQVQVPALLIASDKDRMVRLDQTKATADALGADFLALEECGHFQHIEQTANCAKALSGFFAKL